MTTSNTTIPIQSPHNSRKDLLFQGRLAGERFYDVSSTGEKVPFRRIRLSPTPQAFGGQPQPSVYLTDVTGPFGENANNETPVKRQRPLPGSPTQLAAARAGIVTPEMAYVATRENLCRQQLKTEVEAQGNEKLIKLLSPALDAPLFTPEQIRDLVATRQAVIPCNFNHPECEPMVIGKHFATKVNANIGTSSSSKNWREELDKLKESLLCGADTVMDLSTGKSIIQTREMILRHSPVPIGTVPLYETLERAGGKPELMSWDIFKEVMIDQAEQGVDYMTIHAGLLNSHVELTRSRLDHSLDAQAWKREFPL